MGLRDMREDGWETIHEDNSEARGRGMGVGAPRQGDGGASQCRCPECGKTYPHARGIPCASRTCPICKIPLIGIN